MEGEEPALQMETLRGALIGLVVIFGMGWLNGQGEGQWATLRGNVQRSGYIPLSLPSNFHLSWVRYFKGERLSSCFEPIVAEGKVFIATHAGNVYALDAETGKPVWRFQAGGAFLHSPAYAQGILAIGSTDGYLYGLGARTGKLLWRVHSPGGFSSSPAISENLVFIGSRGGEILAVDLKSGKVVWRRRFGVPFRQTPAVSAGKVFLTSEDLRVHCLEGATGKILWTSSPLVGQTARDYYPVLVQVGGRVFLVIRTNPIVNFSQRIGEDRELLCRNAGIESGDWRALEEWTRSEKAKGNPQLWKREEEAILRYLEEKPEAQTFFILDGETDREVMKAPVLWVGGCQGVGTPPIVLPDGRLLLLYRTAYGNWNLGVAPLVALGIGEWEDGHLSITPLFHSQGMVPPWNTFWGTADESQNFVLVGDLLLIVHQGTLSGFNLKNGELFPVFGERDTWGGFPNLPWARNEWHGPARGGVAVAGRRIYWQTGSRLLCLVAGEGEEQEVKEEGVEGNEVPTVTAPQLELPSSKELKEELARVVGESISQRWMPLCIEPGLAGREFLFENSGEVFQALAWAYPHLPPNLQARVKAYLAQEWEKHPPYREATWYKLDEGRAREWFQVPSTLRTPLREDRYHPFGNLYAVYLYAERCKEWERVKRAWGDIKDCFEEFLGINWRIDPSVGALYANRYLSSLLALVRLAERFGDGETAKRAKGVAEKVKEDLIAWWRNSAQRLSLPQYYKNIKEWDAFITKGDALFLALIPHKARVALLTDLTPEVADILKREAKTEVEKVWRVFATLCPTWHLVGEERQVHYGENFLDPPDFALNAFKFFAWLCNPLGEELVKRLDIPFCRADLYYVEKLGIALSLLNGE